MSNIVQLHPNSLTLEDVAYELGTRPLPFMRREWQEWLEISRVSADMLELVLQDTLKAPRPSWAYFRAIVQRCIREGATTFDKYKQRSAAHRKVTRRDKSLDDLLWDDLITDLRIAEMR